MSWSINRFGTKKALTKLVEESRFGTDDSPSQKEFLEAKPIILARLAACPDDYVYKFDAGGSFHPGYFHLAVDIARIDFVAE